MASVVHPSGNTGRLRAALGLLALAVLAVAGIRLIDIYLNSPRMPRPIDFLQVWSAGRLHLTGENPYDATRMFELQQANRLPSNQASMMWNPPWALALVMHLGVLSVNAAQIVWITSLFGSVILSALALWRMSGGSPARRWVPVSVALAFVPTWFMLIGGQIVGLLLLGLVGFLYGIRNNRPVLAGVCVSLTAIKPHLFAPLALGLLIDSLRTPFGRRIVLGGLLALVVASIVATIPNPDVWNQYVAASTGAGSEKHKSLTQWVNPTIGAWVRFLLPGQPFWVQWIPTAVAMVGFGIYWGRYGSPEKWSQALFWIVPLGLLTAPYGSWICDQVLLLVPIVFLLARWNGALSSLRSITPAIAVYMAANVLALVLMLSGTDQEYYVWFAPVVVAAMAYAAASTGIIRTAPAPIVEQA